jgi:CheY-like chemotaxis protein
MNPQCSEWAWLQAASRHAPERGKKGKSGGGAQRNAGALRILIVEDEAVIALELEAMLEGLGHSVVAIAGSEGEAVRLSQAKHPNLILMDVRLGRGGDGINAARAILQEMPVSVVFCSAYARVPGRARAWRKSIPPASCPSRSSKRT